MRLKKGNSLNVLIQQPVSPAVNNTIEDVCVTK